MTDAVEVMEPKRSVQELSEADYAMLLKLLDAFTTGLKVIRFLIIVTGAIGMVALAVQHAILADQAYRGYHK